MTYILLIRHGQNDWVDKKRLAGWTPGVHLNDEGLKQAQALANRLSHMPISAVYSSPLERCLETAAIIADVHSKEIIVRDDVGEVRYGKWEGKSIKKLVRKKTEWIAIQHYPSRFRFPAGESLREVQHRAVAGLEEIAGQHDKEMIVIVSHADVIKLVLAHYLGIHIDLFQRLVISTASVSVIALFKPGGMRVLRVNDDGLIQVPSETKQDKDQESRAHDEKA